MALKINTNLSSINAQKNLSRADDAIKTPLERTSSGKRINSAKDDAAGLAIAARLATQILGTNVAIRNTNDGISLAQTAEGALQETADTLQRIRELSIQSANATNSTSDRQALQAEVNQLTAELNRVAETTEFNGQKILDGSFGSALFQVGANENETIAATTANFQNDQYGDYRLEGEGSSVGAGSRLATAGSVDITGADGSASVTYAAGASAKAVSEAINQVSEQTGVEGSARTQAALAFTAAGGYQLNLTADNGVTETVGFNIESSQGVESLQQAAAAINDYTDSTGIVAAVNENGSGIVLTHYEGENITISDTAQANAGDVTVSTATGSQTLVSDTAADTAVVTGQITFDASQNFIASGTAGAVVNSASQSAQLLKVAELDVTTVDQASQSLAIIDAAISRVSLQRANFGALQSKFESAVRNSEVYTENLSASRSRIEDADYAKETAELTRQQILNASGIAMLGQANASQKFVLGLLQRK